MKILKNIVIAESKKLNVVWSTLDTDSIIEEKPIDISKLTRDEQADLIIEKLKAPPKPIRTLEDELADILSMEIAAAIDKEIIEKLSVLPNLLSKGQL